MGYASYRIWQKNIIPGFEKLTEDSKKFILRDIYQVLGKDLNIPFKFVLCWTRDGCICTMKGSEKTGRKGLLQ